MKASIVWGKKVKVGWSIYQENKQQVNKNRILKKKDFQTKN